MTPAARAAFLARRLPSLTLSDLVRLTRCDLAEAAEARRLAELWRGDGWASDEEIRRRQAERSAPHA